MLRLLLLLGLPFAVYAYWRFIAKAPQEQRAQRTQAVVFGAVSLVVIALALRRGSPTGVGLATLGLLAWNLTMRYRARKAGEPKAENPTGRSNPPPGGGSGGRVADDRHMSVARALQILGLDAGASQEQIQQRYRQLMLGVHPDKGGSGYLAAQINQARDVLLKGRGR